MGLKPTATAVEIEQAYARELLRPRAFGGLAEVGIAYATLKDTAKRRAYDQAIGLAPTPVVIAAPALHSWQITASAHVHPATQISRGPTPAAESFIAASLRQLADPDPLVRPSAERRPEPGAPAAPEPAPELDAQAAPEPPNSDEAEEAQVQWRRPALVGGGLVLAAVMLGAWAGTAVRDPSEPVEPDAAVTMSVPAAKPLSDSGAAEEEPALSALAGETGRSTRAEPPTRLLPRASAAGTRARRTPPRPIELTAAEEQELAGGPFADSAVQQVEAAADAIKQAEPEAATPAAAAKLPLSGRTVARTIGRIGYACGAVSSVTPVEGGTPGVFKVTCASGDAYQARPVNGRYRFRRWGRQ